VADVEGRTQRRRNDLCPCGSGKKFKRCCLERVEAEERSQRLQAESDRVEAERDEAPTFAAVLERARAALQESRAFEEVDGLAERVLELIDAGQYDEAEATAGQLESEYPDEPLAIERLGQVHEARGSGVVGRRRGGAVPPSCRADGRAGRGPLLRLLPRAARQGDPAARSGSPGPRAAARSAVANANRARSTTPLPRRRSAADASVRVVRNRLLHLHLLRSRSRVLRRGMPYARTRAKPARCPGPSSAQPGGAGGSSGCDA